MRDGKYRGSAAISPNGRSLNIDLIRTLACFLVISVHFFRSSGFYEQPMQGIWMFGILYFRNFCMICVPLFMLLTGYLSGHFVWGKKHMLRIANVLEVYLLSSMICILYRRIFEGTVALRDVIPSVMRFDGAPYAWYVEMHLGLMLMIPFFNMAYRNMKKRDKRVWIGCCLCLICLSALPPQYGYFDYWASIYPIAYYFMGAYLAEYRPVRRNRSTLTVMMLSVLAATVVAYLTDRGRVFSWPAVADYRSIFIVAVAVIFFARMMQADLSVLPDWACSLIRWAAKNTLPAYLLSYCFDQFIYAALQARYASFMNIAPLYVVVVPLIFICSLLAGQAVTTCTAWLMKPTRYVVERIPTPKWLQE